MESCPRATRAAFCLPLSMGSNRAQNWNNISRKVTLGYPGSSNTCYGLGLRPFQAIWTSGVSPKSLGLGWSGCCCSLSPIPVGAKRVQWGWGSHGSEAVHAIGLCCRWCLWPSPSLVRTPGNGCHPHVSRTPGCCSSALPLRILGIWGCAPLILIM